MRLLINTVFGALLALLLISPAFADAAGKAQGVDPQAGAALSGETRTLIVGSDIFLGDKITTGPQGQVQILFADNTKLVIGPNSALTIDDYLLRNDGSAGKLVIDLLGGSFRFATGDSPKAAYQVNTPTGTIGVRGTKYDVYVDWVTHIAYVMVYTGQVLLNQETERQQTVLAGFCHIGIIDTDDTELLGSSNDIFGEQREDLKGWFMFSLNQSSLLNQYRFGNAGDCTRRPPVNNAPQSIVDNTSTDCGPFETDEGGTYPNNCGNCPPGSAPYDHGDNWVTCEETF